MSHDGSMETSYAVVAVYNVLGHKTPLEVASLLTLRVRVGETIFSHYDKLPESRSAPPNTSRYSLRSSEPMPSANRTLSYTTNVMLATRE